MKGRGNAKWTDEERMLQRLTFNSPDEVTVSRVQTFIKKNKLMTRLREVYPKQTNKERLKSLQKGIRSNIVYYPGKKRANKKK